MLAASECSPIALLIDSHVAGEFGGTGAAADWAGIAKWKEQSQSSIPIVLAGGLTPGECCRRNCRGSS